MLFFYFVVDVIEFLTLKTLREGGFVVVCSSRGPSEQERLMTYGEAAGHIAAKVGKESCVLACS